MVAPQTPPVENLDSAARISVIDTFVPMVVKWETTSRHPQAVFDPVKECFWNPLADIEKMPFFKDMPMIINGDGEPWDLGNLYLINLFYKKAKIGEPNIKTLRSHADCLLHYLRWTESTQKKDDLVHILYLPKNESRRVSYRYRRYLLGLVRKNIISPGTASKRMSRVVSFYRSCIEDKLVDQDDIPNLPFEEVRLTVLTTNRIGLPSFTQVRSSNLAIRTAKPTARVDEINDEGEKLRPLTDEEQSLVLTALQKTSTRSHQLIFLFSLFTGARIQTIGTLRIRGFIEAFQKQRHLKEIRMKVGRGTEVDTKNNKSYVLHIPTLLAAEILKYIESPIAKEYRKKSYYGETDENYIFLTKGGDPFYTSTNEINDRQGSTNPWTKDAKFKIKDGQAIREKVKFLISTIRQTNPSFRAFRFHDLRATFANNFLSDQMSVEVTQSLPGGRLVDVTRRKALSETRKRMAHKYESTTELYLDYSENIEREKQATELFETRLFKWL